MAEQLGWFDKKEYGELITEKLNLDEDGEETFRFLLSVEKVNYLINAIQLVGVDNVDKDIVKQVVEKNLGYVESGAVLPKDEITEKLNKLSDLFD